MERLRESSLLKQMSLDVKMKLAYFHADQKL